RDIPHVLKVRVIADMRDRVKEEMRRENISADEALYVLKKDDQERRKWALQVYGVDPWDSRLYDIVLHIGKLTVDDALEILSDTVRKPNFQTTPESRKLVDDLALAATVKADLAQIAPDIKVDADNGKVFIGNSGDETGNKDDDQIKTLAMQVDGVKEVIFNKSASREQHGHVNPFHNI
ncbi:MAG: cytidylate kinase family protein, partial [Desulfobacterales bacterium]